MFTGCARASATHRLEPRLRLRLRSQIGNVNLCLYNGAWGGRSSSSASRLHFISCDSIQFYSEISILLHIVHVSPRAREIRYYICTAVLVLVEEARPRGRFEAVNGTGYTPWAHKIEFGPEPPVTDSGKKLLTEIGSTPRSSARLPSWLTSPSSSSSVEKNDDLKFFVFVFVLDLDLAPFVGGGEKDLRREYIPTAF